LTGPEWLFSDFHAREPRVRRDLRRHGGTGGAELAIESPDCGVNEWTGFVALLRLGASRDEE
jgi:hypothetical protein